MITVVVVTLRHSKPLGNTPKEITDLVSGRLWSLDHVESAEGTMVIHNMQTDTKHTATCAHLRQKWAIDMRSGHCSDCGAPLFFGKEKL